MTRTQQATGSSSECNFHGGGALRCACRSDGRSSRDNARDHHFLHAQPLQPICGDHLPCGAHLVVMLGRVQIVDSECLRCAAVFVTQLNPVPCGSTIQVRALIVSPERFFCPAHACFAGANASGRPRAQRAAKNFGCAQHMRSLGRAHAPNSLFTRSGH